MNRVVWVLDRGFNSRDNRTELRRQGVHYIVAGDDPLARPEST
ncbi:MAG: hypothetical protein ACREOL_05325 [Candidatus Dormibacteria bacterium]